MNAQAAGGRVKVSLVKGWAGASRRQRLNLRALGLRRTGDANELPDAPSVRGVLSRVAHLVRVERAQRS